MSKLLITLFTAALLVGCNSSKPLTQTDNTDDINPGVSLPEAVADQPNILLIISDDQGIDASAQYGYSLDLPNTPTLDALAQNGLVFNNMWTTPACATSRAQILTGKHGIHTGVNSVPASLPLAEQSIQAYLKSQAKTQNYQTGFFGKWHLSPADEINRPNQFGIDYYAGSLTNLNSYTDWTLTVNGEQSQQSQYHTEKITDLAIDWITKQPTDTPWFSWVAYSAPHAPFHLPPADLHNRDYLSGAQADINAHPRDYYLAAIEAMDHQIARLLDALPEQTRNNTIIIYMSDNGTPKRIIDPDTGLLSKSHSKGTLYQGGINVPFMISGELITRKGEYDDTLISGTDLFATIAEMAGLTLHEINDSHSFYDLLFAEHTASEQSFVFSNYEDTNGMSYAVRDQDFKLITHANNQMEFYQLSNEQVETNNLLDNAELSHQAQTAFNELTNQLKLFTGQPSESAIDITYATFTNRSANCASYVNAYKSDVYDINEIIAYQGAFTISLSDDKCVFTTNAIPNHDFNDGARRFPNQVSPQNDQFEVTAKPQFANETTALSLQTDNALLLNGVKVDLLAAACFGVGDGKIGCNDMSTPWRYDPIHGENNFNVDSHNAHTQPDGTYHYHGTPNAMYDNHAHSSSPVIGFAADGFPIFGPYIDDKGTIRKALSSYQLKSGSRPAGDGEPGGEYDGTFRDDYEYIAGSGDLDECNGMTYNGVYGYYVTDSYPYILNCFKGTADPSFNKR